MIKKIKNAKHTSTFMLMANYFTKTFKKFEDSFKPAILLTFGSVLRPAGLFPSSGEPEC